MHMLPADDSSFVMLASPSQPNPFHIDNGRFLDSQNRVVSFRGVSLSGCCKFPAGSSPSQGSHDPTGLLDHKTVSFVGRPFPLDEAPQHLARLRSWGFNLVRLLVTWEAIEPKGPGLYDDDYIQYLRTLIGLFPKYGIYCIIDAHQDIFARHSGGSGAPGWTFELAGFDISSFKDSGAAYQHAMNLDPVDPPASVWPTGYQKLSAATMNTLFWASHIFAWKRTVPVDLHPNHENIFAGNYNEEKKIDIGTFLRTSMVEAYGHLADILVGCHALIGFEPMNEPHRGYISLHAFDEWNPMTDLALAQCPSALQSMALGAGYTQTVPYYVPSFPHPSRISHYVTINPPKHGAWSQNSNGCVWKEHGVWEWDEKGDKPVALLPRYFDSDPRTGEPVEWYETCWYPFVRTFGDRVQRAKSDWFILAGPIPNEFCPPWPKEKQPSNFVFAPHFYDLYGLFSKSFGNFTVNVQGLSRGMNPLKAIYFGREGVKSNYSVQLGNIVKKGREATDNAPCIIGEAGIPYDMNKKFAFETGDFRWQDRMMDALWHATEQNDVDLVVWNYCPVNTHKYGDGWYLEDFSIFGLDDRKHKDKVENLDDGARCLKAFKRPHANNIAGIPVSTYYDMFSGKYVFEFANPSVPNANGDNENSSNETVIYLPTEPAKVQVSDGEYVIDKICAYPEDKENNEEKEQDQITFLKFKHSNFEPNHVHRITVFTKSNSLETITPPNIDLDLSNSVGYYSKHHTKYLVTLITLAVAILAFLTF